ncbi:hypothetical protein ACTJKH_00690 [Microbacterium sp. 22215]|uniref:hypothetical protein n=1 Tax=Microbacterium sp. 22215 TaxID=3453893 RepID=UPI003F83C317
MSENPMGFPLSAQERGVLKTRLVADPLDHEARLGLVAWYRGEGHGDQAGRYAIAVDDLATQDELRQYASLLRGSGADDDRMRELSRLPKDSVVEQRASAMLKSALAPTPTRFGNIVDGLASIAWVVFGILVLVTLITTFVVTLRGEPSAPDIAATWAAITLFAAAFASGISAIALAVGRTPIASSVFAAVAILATWGAIALHPFVL